jgi:hypothetical protein
VSAERRDDRGRPLLIRALLFAAIALVGILIGREIIKPADTLPIYHR